MEASHSTLFTAFWQRFCRGVVTLFYRQFEISGLANLPNDRGVILCANHVNALADPVIVQAATSKVIHPLARSGLFANPLLKPWLRLMGAVPIYRPGDQEGNVANNKDSFVRCYELLAKQGTLIIFPEGQSHSDSHLHHLKSGAARLTLGALEANGFAPEVIPVGLNFSRKGRFRGDVLVNFGGPIDLNLADDLSPRQTVLEVNKRIAQGLQAVTVNADSWDDIDLVRRLERFFAMRQGRVRKRSLAQRFSALQRLIEGQKLLREHEPKKVRAVINKLHAYERLIRRFGIKDYHLTLNYKPWFVLAQSVRMLLLILLGLPLLGFAMIHSGLPYGLTRHLATRLAKGEDQYDTAKILVGSLLFAIFWGVQLALVYHWYGAKWMLIYAALVVISSVVALKMYDQLGHIREDIRVFFMLVRKNELKQHLLEKRRDIEVKLAQLVRIAKRLSNK